MKKNIIEIDLSHGKREIDLINSFIFKIARLRDEWLRDVEHLDEILEKIRNKADIFTFWQRFPDCKPKYNFHMEWDNVAMLEIKNFDYWWRHQINKKTRNMVRKALKMGVEAKVVKLNDDFIKGVVRIYNETPIRRNEPFRHYGESFEIVKRNLSKYEKTSDFIGAYYEGELIGFVHLIYTDKYALMSQILSMIKHFNKAPNNLLIAKTVELCAEKGVRYLIYGRMSENTLGKFKKRNGFIKVLVPRYYVPLNHKGKIALRLNLHKGIRGILPQFIKRILRPIYYKSVKEIYLMKLKIKGI